MNTSVFGGLIKDKPKRKRKEMQAEIDKLRKQMIQAGDGFREIHRLACPSPGVVIDWSTICEIAVTELHKCRYATKQLDEIVSINTKPAESEIEKQIEDRFVFAGLPVEMTLGNGTPGKLWIDPVRGVLFYRETPVRVMVIRSNIAYFAYGDVETMTLQDIYQRMVATDGDRDGSILAIMDDRHVARRIVAAMFPDDFRV